MRILPLLILGLTLISFTIQAQTEFNPPIKGFGKVFDVPFATDKPDPSLQYRIVVDVSEKIEDPKELYNSLDHVARMYNLHVYGGVPQKQIDMAVVIWGPSAYVVLNNEAYHKKHGVDNPNLKIIEELKGVGIRIFVCGQSIMKNNIDPKTINPNVTIAVSRLTTVSTYQMKGYGVFKY